MTAQVRSKLAAYGLELDGVGVKDIVLPGEMKTILAQVVTSAKSAEANVIRRREETAATRSLLNTAKVMEDNPVALRLKELETLERVAERIDKISVFGGLDQVLNGLVKLRNGPPPKRRCRFPFKGATPAARPSRIRGVRLTIKESTWKPTTSTKTCPVACR